MTIDLNGKITTRSLIAALEYAVSMHHPANIEASIRTIITLLQNAEEESK